MTRPGSASQPRPCTGQASQRDWFSRAWFTRGGSHAVGKSLQASVMRRASTSSTRNGAWVTATTASTSARSILARRSRARSPSPTTPQRVLASAPATGARQRRAGPDRQPGHAAIHPQPGPARRPQVLRSIRHATSHQDLAGGRQRAGRPQRAGLHTRMGGANPGPAPHRGAPQPDRARATPTCWCAPAPSWKWAGCRCCNANPAKPASGPDSRVTSKPRNSSP